MENLSNIDQPQRTSQEELQLKITRLIKTQGLVDKNGAMSDELYDLNRHYMNEILPNLYLSGMQPTYQLYYLQQQKIDSILTVADVLEPQFPDQFEYKIIEISDDIESNIHQHLDECVTFIRKRIDSGKTVLVHCAAGVSRSASVITAYVMTVKSLSRDDALAYVRTRRPAVHPNDGFMCQLLEYQKILEERRRKENDNKQSIKPNKYVKGKQPEEKKQSNNIGKKQNVMTNSTNNSGQNQKSNNSNSSQQQVKGKVNAQVSAGKTINKTGASKVQPQKKQ
eukprot:403367769